MAMDEAVIKRILPHNVEAEQSVISAMLLGREAIETASQIISGDFVFICQLWYLAPANSKLPVAMHGQ